MSAPPQSPDARRPRRVLVTGGGGFLGRAIVARLVARGDQVRSFARRDYPELRQLGVEVVRGDLADAAAVRAACADCEVVFHAAARAGMWGSYAEYFEPNVRGTEHVLAACAAERVGRVVFTSSPSVVFDGRDVEGGDESLPYPGRYASAYSASKALAEQRVLAANGLRLRTLALRPHLIWGPGDHHILQRLLVRARAGHLRRVGGGRNRVDSIYIDNAADAHVRAADALEANPQAAGRPYFISNGEPWPMWDLINGILAAAGVTPVTRPLSRWAAWTIAASLEAAHKVLGIAAEPRLTRFIVDELSTSHWFDISAARRELGYEPAVSIKEGLSRLAAWFRAAGPEVGVIGDGVRHPG
jgi:nucleoside-diphosphate-sugar epimerase